MGKSCLHNMSCCMQWYTSCIESVCKLFFNNIIMRINYYSHWQRVKLMHPLFIYKKLNDLANYFMFLFFCLLINGLANFLVTKTFFKTMNYWMRPKKKYWVLKFRQEHSLCRSQAPSNAVLLVYSHLWTSFYRFDLSKSHPTNHDSSL